MKNVLYFFWTRMLMIVWGLTIILIGVLSPGAVLRAAQKTLRDHAKKFPEFYE